MNKTSDIFGICEYVSLPDIGLVDVVAKVDTGAYSGAVHCSKISKITRKNDGKKILRIIPSDKHAHQIELEHFYNSYVRSSTGHRIRRYLFDTNIVIKGIAYKIRIGLSDRSDMNYEVLIGRRFLAENDIIVDARINQELDIDRSKKL